MQLGCFGVPLFVILACIAIGIYKRDLRYALPPFGIVLLTLLIQMQINPREASYRACCINQLKQIGIALHNYHDRYGSFPPAYVADADGKPMHSWRVLLLPFMEESDLFEQYRFDEPWDGPNNRKLHMPVWCYRCPSATDNDVATNYVAVVGPATAWPGTKSTKFSDFADGTSNTIMVVEIANSGIHWMEPRDLHVVQMNTKINGKPGQGISSNHPTGACVLFADGSARFLYDNLPPETVKALLTIDGGEKVSPDDWE
jgi:hypothetical protein